MDTEGAAAPAPMDHFRVSSKHLTLASSYFRAMLTGNFKEAQQLKETKEVTVELPATFDSQALLVVLNIIHSFHSKVPRLIQFEQLLSVAIIVDYIDCYEAVQVYVEIWLASLRKELQQGTNIEIDDDESMQREELEQGTNMEIDKIMQWICVAWVFKDSKSFFSSTKSVMFTAVTRIDAFGLPIPDFVLSK